VTVNWQQNDLVIERYHDKPPKVIEAPATVTVSRELLANTGSENVSFIGGLMVICDQVAYRPRAFDRHGNLICDRYPWKDDDARGVPQLRQDASQSDIT
jgi:hypothetical protein